MKLLFMGRVPAVFLSTLPTSGMLVHVVLFTNPHIARLPRETDPGGQDKKGGM